MDRRRFALTFATLLLPGAALAARGTDRPPLEPAGRARLILDTGGTVIPNYVMVLNRSGVLGLNLRKAVPQFDEDRRLPGAYDDLSRPPIRRLLAEAVKVGSIHLFRNSLFVLPDAADIRRGRTAILHRDRAYAPQPRLQAITLTGRPERSEVEIQPRLGEAWRSASRLLLLVSPTLAEDRRHAGN